MNPEIAHGESKNRLFTKPSDLSQKQNQSRGPERKKLMSYAVKSAIFAYQRAMVSGMFLFCSMTFLVSF